MARAIRITPGGGATVGQAAGRPRGSLICALDIGTTKVACLIARVEDDLGSVRILGQGLNAADGLRAGQIVDLEQAQAAVGRAVETAERAAGLTVTSVVVAVSAAATLSERMSVDLALNGHAVGEADLERARAQARGLEVPGERELMHVVAVDHGIDGQTGIRDPRGLFGRQLDVQLHAVTAEVSLRRNLAACAARRYLEIDRLCVGAYAAGLASLVDDEMSFGATVIDMGGGTTDLALFRAGHLIHVDSLPIGGLHVTHDIAEGLWTSLAEAERIKTLHGAALVDLAGGNEPFEVRQLGESGPEASAGYTRAHLARVIQPRLEETFELVRHRLEARGLLREAGRIVVLTGGASRLPGTRDLAVQVLEKKVRLGLPIRVKGLAPDLAPAFTTAAGLIRHALVGRDQPPGQAALPRWGFLARLGHWLKENL